jgi:RNA polymerase sigma factor (sigma-70 family)
VESAASDGQWPARLASHVRERAPFYHHLAYGVLRSNETAADVCQQAFLKAWQERDRIRDHGALGEWLVRVVLNESFCVLRRWRVEREAIAGRSPIVEDEPGPAESIERRDLLMVALARLPEPIREVVVLRTMKGMSGNEVSDLLRISASDVSRRLHEGLDQLREILHGDGARVDGDDM